LASCQAPAPRQICGKGGRTASVSLSGRRRIKLEEEEKKKTTRGGEGNMKRRRRRKHEEEEEKET